MSRLGLKHVTRMRRYKKNQDCAPVRPHPIRILIADDHPALCRGLGLMLQQETDLMVVGYAADGHAAIQLAAELKPDVVIMDGHMPHVNGIEATKRILALLPSTKVIGFSMRCDSWWISAMLKAGACFCVDKTWQPSKLMETIRACMNNNTAAF